jgi:heme/copper-type cytochrome/quinol oxidase subunit 3
MLLSSGVTVTLAHRAVVSGDVGLTRIALGATIYYGFFFTCVQSREYEYAPFAINDGVYGSLFFLLTGFHGIHVCIGILFLYIC